MPLALLTATTALLKRTPINNETKIIKTSTPKDCMIAVLGFLAGDSATDENGEAGSADTLTV